ncbi:MAG: hypothetical protein J6B43_11635 [Lachnospiraceae bacterium]|nr:hypothetical protein [Lachnospiraceae bacterium]
MIRRIKSEIKIIGINFFIVAVFFTIAVIAFAIIAGELLDFYSVSFEVIFPFFVTIIAGEWGKTRADGNFDIIASQSKSVFHWVLCRYVIIFGLSCIFAILSMTGASAVRYELPLWELLIIYFPPAFFLSSLCALFGIICRQEHIATLICGIVWLITLIARSLLRLPGIEYLYLFIRYTGDPNHIWLWNKGIITLAGLFLWGILYGLCRRPNLS